MNYFCIDGLINIPYVNPNCNFWMVRTNDGLFYDEFINEEFIAIGWNSIKKNSFPLEKSQQEFLESSIKENYSTNIPGMAINKCKRFCYELNEGDIAIITGKEKIAFAIIGAYYEENSELLNEEYELQINKKIAQKKYREIEFCPYCKRRKITLISVINERDEINPYLYKALLLNKHSLSCLNPYANTILSSCYDIYYWKNVLSFAFKVQKKNDINAIALSQFIKSFASLLQIEDDNISVKTALHSPGDIVLQITNWLSDYNNTLWVFIGIMVIFGGKAGNFEFPSIFNAAKYFIDRFDNKEIRKLNIEQKRLELEKLEQEIESLRLDNQKKSRLEEAAINLSKAVNNLELKQTNSRIINIEKIKENLNNNS